MLQAADTDLFNPIVPKAHNSQCQCQNLLFSLQINPFRPTGPFLAPVRDPMCDEYANAAKLIICVICENPGKYIWSLNRLS